MLQYNEIGEVGMFFMESREISNQQKEYWEQKAKEGSKKGS
jgi:hypothetical protein